MLDINKENHLASERMAALLFYQDIDGKYPFRNINDLEVVAIKLITSESNRYCREHMLETLNIGKGRNINKYFSQVYESILGFWDDKYNILSTSVNKPHRNDALDYIVYKTLKIIANYKKYTPILNYISKSQYDLQKLKDKLEPLYLDFSHVTKKLLQTINYLRYDIYHINEKFVTLKSIDDKLIPFFELQEKKGKHRMLKATLLPPPIFDTEMELCHRGKNESIPFNRLSSGERQFAYTISNFLYHLVNIDSAWNDYYHDKNHADVIKYHYVNIVFDEVELYFHPDMQRKFMSSLMASLRSVHFSSNLRGINIILATHSPFILSDIPTSNVLCLGTDKHTTQSSFGANIITLLADGFFMDSTFGEYSRSFVSDIADTYYKLQNHDDVIQYYIDHRKRFKYVQKNIGDPILKGIIDKMMIDLEKAYKMFIKEL
jgi:predicted ATP-dependent endonuclease of OLD family